MAGPGCRSMVLPFLLVAVVVPSGSDITSRDAVLRSCESRGIHADWHGFHTALLPRGAQRGIRAVGERRAGTPSISIGGRESCIRHPQDVRCATIRGGKSFEEESEQEQQVGSVPFLTRLDRALAESDEEYPPSDAHGDDGVRVRVLGSSESGEFIQESGDQEDQEDAEIVVAKELMQVGVYTPIEIVDMGLEMLALQPQDVLLDLGCGDGRVCFRAAEAYNCTALGVDLDPTSLIAAENLHRALGFGDRVEFELRDFTTYNLSRCTAAFLNAPTAFFEGGTPLHYQLLDFLREGGRALVVNSVIDFLSPERCVVRPAPLPGPGGRAGARSGATQLYLYTSESVAHPVLVQDPREPGNIVAPFTENEEGDIEQLAVDAYESSMRSGMLS